MTGALRGAPGNDDIRVARAFHEATAHSPDSVRASTHHLDWDVKPLPFKVYRERPETPLPPGLDPVAVDTLTALAAPEDQGPAPFTLEELTALLYYTAGVTRKVTYPGGVEVLFRAAASTGALYQTEVYLVGGAVDGLAPGLYHFCPGDLTLRLLREGDVRAPLAEAAADASVARRAATVVLTGIYWRNTWKYQARGFRHLYWDSGTMLANLLAVGGALGWHPRLLTGFVDRAVDHLLGLDADHEAALELVAVGPETTAAPPAGTLPAIRHATVPLSASEVDYPSLREMQAASSLADPPAVAAWRGRVAPPPAAPGGALVPLPAPRAQAGRGLGDTIQHRGSTRRFGHAALDVLDLATTLACATGAVAQDVPRGLVDLYLVVNAVDGVPPGAYAYWPGLHALEPIRTGEFRRESAFLCLGQPLGGDAAAVIYFLAPLDALLQSHGNRGYRLANLEAGLVGGRAYLAAYAQRFGATGLTFFDRNVVEFFSPHARGKDALFVTALGRAARP